jgi:hypothetical protein
MTRDRVRVLVVEDSATQAEELRLILESGGVRDHGPGVSVELRDRILDKYVRVADAHRQGGSLGKGLGLAFCRIAVEASGPHLGRGQPASRQRVRGPDPFGVDDISANSGSHCDPALLRLVHDQDRTRCRASDARSIRSEQHQIDSAPPLNTHHDQITVAFRCDLQNLAVCSAFTHNCFGRAVASSLAWDQLAQASQSVRFGGSSNALDIEGC